MERNSKEFIRISREDKDDFTGMLLRYLITVDILSVRINNVVSIEGIPVERIVDRFTPTPLFIEEGVIKTNLYDNDEVRR